MVAFIFAFENGQNSYSCSSFWSAKYLNSDKSYWFRLAIIPFQKVETLRIIKIYYVLSLMMQGSNMQNCKNSECLVFNVRKKWWHQQKTAYNISSLSMIYLMTIWPSQCFVLSGMKFKVHVAESICLSLTSFSNKIIPIIFLHW